MHHYLLILFLLISLSKLKAQEKWYIKSNGVGIIELDKPLEKVKSELKEKYTLKNNDNGGFDIYDQKKLIISIWQKNYDKKVGFIKIMSEKFKTIDGIHVGQNINEIVKLRPDFFIEMDEVSGRGYFAPKELQIKGEEYYKSLNLIYFKTLNEKELADYKYSKKSESLRAVKFNQNSEVDYFLIYKWQ